MTFGWSAFLRRWRLAPLLACALLLGGCEIRLGTKFISVLDDERAVATALSAIESNYKGPIRAVKVVIADDGLLLHAQDPNNSRQISEWRLLREQYSFFDLVSFTTDRVSGPRVVEFLAPNVKLDDRLFDLKDVNLFDWGKVADAAIARAALEDKGGVFTIEIARPAVLLPGSGGGPVRWSIEVKSERELARIFANAKGEITGANLNGTIRMRGFNMYQRPELAAEAAAEVRSQAGNQPILMRVSFNSAAIAFETNLRDNSYPIAGIRANSVFNWSYNGLQRTMGSVDTRSHFSNPEAPFAIDDVDWTLLPKIVTDARAALAMPNGRVTAIDVEKPTDKVGSPAPRWKIYIEENNERGEYYADVKGVATSVLLPKSKRQADRLARS